MLNGENVNVMLEYIIYVRFISSLDEQMFLQDTILCKIFTCGEQNSNNNDILLHSTVFLIEIIILCSFLLKPVCSKRTTSLVT